MKLTNKAIPLLPTNGKAEQFTWDDSIKGLAIRINDKGNRRWIIQWKQHGRTRRLNLGTFPNMGAEQARKIALKKFALIQDGHDPHQEKADKRKAHAHTFLSVAKDYVAAKKLEDLRPGTIYDTQRYLLGTEKRKGIEYVKQLYTAPISTITRADIASVVNRVTREHGRAAAGQMRQKLLEMFKWAMQCGCIEKNPVIDSIKPTTNAPRKRVLGDDELAAVWKEAGDGDYGRIVKLLILTGARRQEIGGMRWTEIKNNEWTLPEERSKNREALTLPLTPLALSIIQNAPRQLHRDHVFGTRADEGFTMWGEMKEDLDERLKDKVKEPWVIHDLRRSVATRMGDIGIMPHIVEVILNHLSGHKAGPAGVYNRSVYRDEVRAAMMKWSDHVEALVGGKPTKQVDTRPVAI
jgi:integrase